MEHKEESPGAVAKKAEGKKGKRQGNSEEQPSELSETPVTRKMREPGARRTQSLFIQTTQSNSCKARQGKCTGQEAPNRQGEGNRASLTRQQGENKHRNERKEQGRGQGNNKGPKAGAEMQGFVVARKPQTAAKRFKE